MIGDFRTVLVCIGPVRFVVVVVAGIGNSTEVCGGPNLNSVYATVPVPGTGLRVDYQ